MPKLTFEDIVQNQYLSTFDVEIDGLGTVEMQQISAARSNEIVAHQNTLSGNDLELYISTCALEFVARREVTEQEVTNFRNNVPAGVVSQIYLAGLASTPSTPDIEGAEKN